MKEIPKTGQIYRHYKKGKEYRVLTVARDCDNPEQMHVVYIQLYPTKKFPIGTHWKRNLENFLEEVEVNGKKVKRFELIKQTR